MKDRIVNSKGIPMMSIRRSALFSVTSTPVKEVNPSEKTVDATFTYRKNNYCNWGATNNLPGEMCDVISGTGVLQTGLNYKVRCACGQGILSANESEEIDKILNSYNVRKYLTDTFRDLFKLGNSFPCLIFNKEKNKIVSLTSINARHCRISDDKTKLLVYGDFENGNPGDDSNAKVYTILNETNPIYDFEVMKSTGVKEDVIAFPRLKNSISNNDYYANPDWVAAWKSGWLDIAHQVPLFLKKAFENAMNLMWHVQIPYSFIDSEFPENEFQSPDERTKVINEFLDGVEKNLAGDENAMKSLTNLYNVNEFGKVEEKWIIDRLDADIKTDERLATSAAANSEILFSLMVNPSVLGAGMPGGPYAGNAGSGSDIREGLLVSMILSHIEKQDVLEPIKLMLKYNGYGDVDIKFRNITLTTLDSGNSTKETVV